MITAIEARNLTENHIKNKTISSYLPGVEKKIKEAANRGESSVVVQYVWDSQEGLIIRAELEKVGFDCTSYYTSFDYYESFKANYIKISWSSKE